MRLVMLLGGVAVLMAGTPALANEVIVYKYDARGRLIKVERSVTVNDNVDTEVQHDKANNRKKVKTTGSSN